MKSFVVSALALVLMFVAASHAQAQSPNSSPSPALVVSPTGPFVTIQAALDAARLGDHIEVHGGTYRGPLVVSKTVSLEGVDYPVIDNGGDGTVVTLSAPDITFRGFELRGSGSEPDRDHAGITLAAPRGIVENNRLREVLFGIFVANAPDSIVRDNDIASKTGYEIGRQGDAIRLWYSPRVTVEQNHVHDARDVVIWYSSGVRLRDNLIERGRYGVHLMYCDNAIIERNRLSGNSVGIYAMYSNDLVMRENLIRGQRGPSGYAFGFKDSDNVEVVSNAVVDNRAGFFIDGMPFSPQGFGRIHDNIIAFNDVGAILQPAVRGDVFENNTFWENIEQVAVQGTGALTRNTWRGNFWSDYAGYDANDDGRGDAPYRSDRFFENITDREPMLRALIYSPAAQAIEFAGAAFPIVKPQPKLSDPAPRIEPGAIPAFALQSRDGAGAMAGSAIALLLLGVISGAMAFKKNGTQMNADERRKKNLSALVRASLRPNENLSAVRVENLSKQYGKVQVLTGVSFDARSGEALALWGPNGAGKTTLLKAMLGLIDFKGAIAVAGFDVARAGKAARAQIGYIPQEATFYDLSVQATLEFYARLKKASVSRVPVLLERVGLGEHAQKPVPALSGGLKQRLALAVAVLSDPPVASIGSMMMASVAAKSGGSLL
jgi:nitrous oxidase accessory protein